MHMFACANTQQATAVSAEYAKSKEKGVEVIKEPSRCVCQTNCVERPLRAYFQKHGRYVAKHPWPFLLIPLILTGCMGYGLRHLAVITDTEYLVTPRNGPAKSVREMVQHYFHVDQLGGFHPERAASLDGFTDIIIIAKDGGSILTPQHMAAIMDIEQMVLNVTVKDDDGQDYGFKDICATWDGECMEQPLLYLYGRDPAKVNTTRITYPKSKKGLIFLGNSFGHPNVSEDGTLLAAKATRITFFVRYETLAEQEISNKWFDKLEKSLLAYSHPEIEIYHSATNSLAEQFEQGGKDIMDKFSAPVALLILFSIFSCMMNDWVRSKPYLALSGVLSVTFSLVTTFGFLAALGIGGVPQMGLVPFLTLGVGVDNMFILISAWRNTDVDALVGLDMHKRVQIRMGEAMKEAALSITITSLTNILAFGVGGLTQFRMVERFCLFTGTSILFCYLFQITFFAAAMVFSGWREEANRHCVTLCKVMAKKEARERGWWYRVWCASGRPGRYRDASDGKTNNILPVTDDAPTEPEEEDQHLIMSFFRNVFGPILMKPWAMALVLVLHGLVLGGAIYGCYHVRKGVSFHKLSNTGSYLYNYYDQKEIYFNQYSVAVGVVISEPLDYSDPAVQHQVEQVLEAFTNDTEYFCNDNTVSWLADYLGYVDYITRKPRSRQEFLDMLRYQFLTLPGVDRHRLDISFDAAGTKIEAARFYVQSVYHTKIEDTMMAARRVAESIKHLNVSVFHQSFIYYDQPIIIWQDTIQNILIAIGMMFLVSLLFLPQPATAIWVALATASIETGVIGYMTLWDVNVDMVSMTSLLLCIGFSVDFAVHITYGFMTGSGSAKEKAIEALALLGYPVLQSACSTILAIIFISSAVSYLFLSFFRTLMLVIILGVWHALFLLPVVLRLVSGKCCCPTPPTQCHGDCTTDEVIHTIKQCKHMPSRSGRELAKTLAHCQCADGSVPGTPLTGTKEAVARVIVIDACSTV